jgi:uncharacterized membrane protein YhaH (DUF805 family)
MTASYEMTPIDWAKRPLEKYADFSGRASRPEYWWFILAYLAIYAFATILESITGLGGMIFGRYGPLTPLLAFGLLVPGLAAAVRRLHDTDRSGWWVLLGFVPLAGLVVVYFLALEGTKGTNQFGPPPEAEPVTAE